MNNCASGTCASTQVDGTERAPPATCTNRQKHAGEVRQYLAPVSWWEGSLAMASLKTGVAQEHEHVSSGERESMLPDQHLVEHMIVLVPLVANGRVAQCATVSFQQPHMR